MMVFLKRISPCHTLLVCLHSVSILYDAPRAVYYCIEFAHLKRCSIELENGIKNKKNKNVTHHLCVSLSNNTDDIHQALTLSLAFQRK